MNKFKGCSLFPNSYRKPVLITGASSGIGKETARYLCEMGFQVFGGVRREKDGDSLRELSGNAITPVILDITKQEDIEKAVQFVQSQTGRSGLYGLVNNAGIPVGGPIEYIDVEKIRAAMEVNLYGAISVIQAFLPMIRKRKGRIINVSSISGRIALPFVGPYAASKFALEAISDALRVELKPWGIPVSIIEPGDVSTPIWEKAAQTINQTIDGLPQSAHERYGPVFEKMNAIQNHGIQPLFVAKKIYLALIALWPQARYLAGADARILVLIAHLPPFLRDFIIRRFIPDYGDSGEAIGEKSPSV